MSQHEVLDYLVDIRKKGDETFYSVPQMYAMMQYPNSKRTLFNCVNRLWKSKYIEHDSEQIIMDVLNNRKPIRRYRALWKK